MTAADANRYFSKLLPDVAGGDCVVVTSRGKPVAKIVPMDEAERGEAERVRHERERAWKAHLAPLRAQPAMNIPITWTRDDLYDDDF